MADAGSEYYAPPRYSPQFSTAWDCWQFACQKLEDAHRLLFLAELTGDSCAYIRYAEEVRFLTLAREAAHAEWLKTGPSQ